LRFRAGLLRDVKLLLPVNVPGVEDIGPAAGKPNLIVAVTGVVITDIRKYPPAAHLGPLGNAIGDDVRGLKLFGCAQDEDVDDGA
jgi:hypothetical protein